MTTARPPLATVENLSDWIGEPIEADSADFKRAEAVLRVASSLIRSPKVTNRTWLTDTGELVDNLPEEVAQVCVQAAARRFTNPEGYEQERQDDFYGSKKVEEDGVYLTESERLLLDEYTANPNGGLRTIQTTRDDFPATSDSLLTGDPILPPYYL